jgi:hypothetical protein
MWMKMISLNQILGLRKNTLNLFDFSSLINGQAKINARLNQGSAVQCYFWKTEIL